MNYRLNSHKDYSESLFLEINFRFRKWLIVGGPLDQGKSIFLESLYRDHFICQGIYENGMLFGDPTITTKNKHSQFFADSFNSEDFTKKQLLLNDAPLTLILSSQTGKHISKKKKELYQKL